MAAVVAFGLSAVVAVQDPVPAWELELTDLINGVNDAVGTLTYPIMQLGTLGGPLLVAAGIVPYVTLYHWDLPQALLNPANGTYGWYSTDTEGNPDPAGIVPHFVDFADLCFARYGGCQR